MCFSAKVWSDYRQYAKAFDAEIHIEDFVRLYEQRAEDGRTKISKGIDAAFVGEAAGASGDVARLIVEWNAAQVTKLEQELFAQKTRLNTAVRALQTKTTKKAQEDERIAGNKIAAAEAKLTALRRTELKSGTSRIFPGQYGLVLTSEDGQRVVRPMRYQCRPAGKPPSYDVRYPGTYNARRDNLEGSFWKPLFGHTHALMIAETFYENVEDPDGKNRVLQFTPRTGEPMLVACLWSHWSKGEDELLSFAAITDEPEPEVAQAGHDRTIINIKPEHVDAWLNPDPGDLAPLYAIFDDKRHPFYEHQLAA